jgi:hypothetical protein
VWELLAELGGLGEVLEWAVALGVFLLCLTAVYRLEVRLRR